jgi:hypothetical protein
MFAEDLVTVRPRSAVWSSTPGGHVDAIDSGTRLAGPVPPVAAAPASPLRAVASRLRVTRPAWQGLLAFAIYQAVFVIGFALPLISHLDVPQVREYWTDPNFYTWSMRWWPYAITHGLNPLYSTQVGAPAGYNLAWATTTPSVGVLMWPVTATFGVVVSFNVMLLLVPPVSAWAAFVAARRLTRRFWASLLAGAVYGFTPFELVHSLQGQPNLTVIALFPLLVYLVLRWWDESLGNTWFAVAMAVAMAVEFYTFDEAFVDMTVVLAGGLVIGCAVAERGQRTKLLRLAGLTAVAYAAAVAAAAPYLMYALRHYPATLTRQLPIFSLSPIRMILPSSDKLFGLTSLTSYSNSIGRYSIDDYVGLPLLAVLLAMAIFAWPNKLTRLIVIAFVFVIALALGPNVVVGHTNVVPLPWGGLWRLPLARSAEPSRLIIFAYLLLALALALWLATPARHPRARWALGLLAVVVMFADLPTFAQATSPVPAGYSPPAAMRPTNQLPPFITDGLYRRYLRPGETVVIVTHRGNAGMLFQADADFYFRIAGGFINSSLTRQDALPIQVALLSHSTPARVRGFRAYVRQAGIGAIIVEHAWAEPWMSVFGRIGLHGTSVGGVTVYSTGTNGTRFTRSAVMANTHSY